MAATASATVPTPVIKTDRRLDRAALASASRCMPSPFCMRRSLTIASNDPCRELLQRVAAARRGGDAKAFGREHLGQRVAHEALVVDDQDVRRGHRLLIVVGAFRAYGHWAHGHWAHGSLGERSPGERSVGDRSLGHGSRMVKRAPPSSRFSAVKLPPCARTMPYETERPKPVPLLVVKNGSKMRSRSAGRDARTFVLDRELDFARAVAVPLARRDRDAPVRAHRAGGVQQQIDDDLLEPPGIARTTASGFSKPCVSTGTPFIFSE